MKRLNKILALVLAMAMMFGVVSICASAADTTNASYKIAFVDNNGDAITSVTAGQTANVIISIKTNGYAPIFAFKAFYDYTALTHVRQNATTTGQSLSGTNCRELLDRFKNDGEMEDPGDELLQIENEVAGNEYVKDWGSAKITVTPHKDTMYPSDFTDAQKAQYKAINFGYLANSADSCLTVNTNGEYAKMLRLRFIAEKDTELNQSVFYFEDDTTATYISIDPDDMPLRNGQTSSPVVVSNLTVEYEGIATPSYTVNTLDAQVQWADKEAGLMNLGFRGQFVGFDVEADKGTTVGPNGGTNLKEDTQLKEVGIILTKGTGTGTKYPVHTVYNFKDGGYFYRLVVGDVSYTDTQEFSAKAYVVIGGKTFEASNTITTTGAAQYNRAKDQMGAK